MTTKKRTRARTAQPEITGIIPSPLLHPIQVRDHDGTVHTHYLSDFGMQRIADLTAGGMGLNNAIRVVLPNAITPVQPDPLRTPACIVEMGLEWPCGVDDVKRWWRTQAIKHHTDHGGESAAFVIARKQYKEAMAFLGGAA